MEELVSKRLCLAAQGGVLIATLKQRAIDVKRPRGAPAGNAWCLAHDHFDPEILYAGYLGIGIFRSLDAGSNWVTCTPKRAQGEEIWSLAASPWKSQTVNAGTSGPRLCKSTDAGQDWQEIKGIRDVPGAEHWSFPEPPHIAHIRTMAFDAQAKEVLYLGVEEGGILRTRNEKNWQALNEGLHENIHTRVPSRTALWPARLSHGLQNRTPS